MDFLYDPEVYKQTYAQALENNTNSIEQISKFEKELQDVRSNLEENLKQLYMNVLVPVGDKAMIKAKLVHTNETYVNLGDRYFLKTSSKRALEICERMIERCHQNVLEFEKERKLLDANLRIPDEMGVFADETLKDIVEPYDEEYEKEWREQHRRKVQEQKQRERNSDVVDETLLEQDLEKLDLLEAEERISK